MNEKEIDISVNIQSENNRPMDKVSFEKGLLEIIDRKVLARTPVTSVIGWIAIISKNFQKGIDKVYLSVVWWTYKIKKGVKYQWKKHISLDYIQISNKKN